MGDFFQGLHSGIQFPQVVWNQGPLPSGGRLPQPLHNNPDARINYNSSLLGDITPYAYGEPGYLSSQTAYLNIPHKIQKIVPIVHLPDAKRGQQTLFELSHPVDDGDLAFVLRLNKNSFFCTGSAHGDTRRNSLGTAVDPLINLATVNYLLSGFQLGYSTAGGNLWAELLSNIDPKHFGNKHGARRPAIVSLQDLIRIMRDCIRPFGIVRGSEKQGGQNETTLSPATWPVPFVVSVTIDGKESNVLNVWHHKNINAGDDLVLRWKLKRVDTYTLNHYYKGVKRQGWELNAGENKFVWQLVPDILTLDGFDKAERELLQLLARPGLDRLPPERLHFKVYHRGGLRDVSVSNADWAQLGYWHIGRSQLMSREYGPAEFWNNDLANQLMTNHLDMTIQPVYQQCPFFASGLRRVDLAAHLGDEMGSGPALSAPSWQPELRLEQLGKRAREPEIQNDVDDDEDEFWNGPNSFVVSQDDLEPNEPGQAREPGLQEVVVEAGIAQPVAVESVSLPVGSLPGPEEAQVTEKISTGLFLAPEPPAEGVGESLEIPVPGLGGPKKQVAAQKGAKRRAIGGSLLKPDGTSEDSMVGMI